jgi:hypothetical protein
MEKGDLSNRVEPRLVIVFETLIASFTNVSRGKFDLALRKGQWKKALQQVEINELVAKNILDLVYRKNFTIDIVTFIDPDFADALEEFLEDEAIPFGHVNFTTVERLSRQIAYRPDIAAIFDGDPNHAFTYGAKGKYVDPSSPMFL